MGCPRGADSRGEILQILDSRGERIVSNIFRSCRQFDTQTRLSSQDHILQSPTHWISAPHESVYSHVMRIHGLIDDNRNATTRITRKYSDRGSASACAWVSMQSWRSTHPKCGERSFSRPAAPRLEGTQPVSREDHMSVHQFLWRCVYAHEIFFSKKANRRTELK